MSFHDMTLTKKLSEDESTYNSDLSCDAPHLLAVECHDDFELRIEPSFDNSSHTNLTLTDSSDHTLAANNIVDLSIDETNDKTQEETHEERSETYSIATSRSSDSINSLKKNKRKNNIWKKLCLRNKSKHVNTEPSMQEKKEQHTAPKHTRNQSSHEKHTRDLSTLSTTPLSCLEDDVKDFLVDLSKNSKAAAYLEKERSSMQEMKVLEAERKQNLERLQYQEQHRQVLVSSKRMQFIQSNMKEKVVVQLDDHDLMNLTKSQTNLSDQQEERSTKAKDKQRKLHKRYFSLAKESAIFNESKESEVTLSKSEKALKTTDRKLFNDRRLLKRYGSLSTYDKEFMLQVFQEEDQ